MKAQEIEPDDVAYGALLSAFARVGDLERAEKYFNMMERGSDDLKPNQIVLGIAPGQCNQQALCVATQKDRRVEQIVSLLKLVIRYPLKFLLLNLRPQGHYRMVFWLPFCAKF